MASRIDILKTHSKAQEKRRWTRHTNVDAKTRLGSRMLQHLHQVLNCFSTRTPNDLDLGKSLSPSKLVSSLETVIHLSRQSSLLPWAAVAAPTNLEFLAVQPVAKVKPHSLYFGLARLIYTSYSNLPNIRAHKTGGGCDPDLVVAMLFIHDHPTGAVVMMPTCGSQ